MVVSMDFKNAEIAINVSLLFNGPPLFIFGANSIGKSEMLKSCSKSFRHAFYTGGMDYGGLQELFPKMASGEIKTFVLSDMQSVISRRKVRDSTLGAISSLSTEGLANSATFQAMRGGWAGLNKKTHINFIIGGTENHVGHLVSLGDFDFMSRFIFINVTREKDDYTPDKFKLETEMTRKYDHNKYKNYIELKFPDFNQRQNQYTNSFVRGLLALGVDVTEFIEQCKSSMVLFNRVTNIYGVDIKSNFISFGDALKKCVELNTGEKNDAEVEVRQGLPSS